MTSTSNLPWDTDGTTVTTTGNDMHARATSLAHAAMEAVAGQDFDPANSDYARAQAHYDAELVRIRAENAQRHVAANNARAQAAAAARAERQAAHLARNETAKIEAQQRKAKAA